MKPFKFISLLFALTLALTLTLPALPSGGPPPKTNQTVFEKENVPVITSTSIVIAPVDIGKPKIMWRMPPCYTYGCQAGSCSGLAGWASAVGYGMAMYGYTGVQYEEHCCGDACFSICASMCGTPPADQPIAINAAEQMLTVNIRGMDAVAAKNAMTEPISRLLKQGTVLKDIVGSSKDGTLTIFYYLK